MAVPGGMNGSGWGVGTGQTDDSAFSEGFFFGLDGSGRAPLRDRAKACASNALNADYVTLYTASPEFRGSGSFILWIL